MTNFKKNQVVRNHTNALCQNSGFAYRFNNDKEDPESNYYDGPYVKDYVEKNDMWLIISKSGQFTTVYRHLKSGNLLRGVGGDLFRPV
jgi:hypothetical protein